MTGKWILTAIAAATLSAGAAEVSLEKDLVPLFQRSCGTCHAPDSGVRGAIKEKVYFNTKKDLLGKVGGPIVAGEPDKSGLIKVLDHTAKFGKKKLVMPPPKADEPAFTKEEIEKVKAWIKEKVYFNTKKDLLGKVGGPIVAGDPDKSGLIKVLDHTAKFGKKKLVMPPPKADEPAFTKEEIEKVKAWIKAGAKDN